MYAIIRSGNKQFKVKRGDVIYVDLLKDNPDEVVVFDDVLFVAGGDIAPKIGAPTIPNCRVEGKLMKVVKGPKLYAVKYKRRKNYRRKVGHRQQYHEVEITDIVS